MRILFVGDTHMMPYAAQAANQMAADENVDRVIQVGDFGYTFDATSQGVEFLDVIAKASVPWMFIRGNHDSTSWLRRASGSKTLHGTEPIEVRDNLQWIPDGCVLTFDGMSFSFMGGAYSIDVNSRVPGVSYWEDECPSVLSPIFKTDVMVSHDLPQSLFMWAYSTRLCYDLPNISEKHEARSKESRMILEGWFEGTSPRLVVHGHYHVPYALHGDPNVVGLGANGDVGSMWVFDTEDDA